MLFVSQTTTRVLQKTPSFILSQNPLYIHNSCKLTEHDVNDNVAIFKKFGLVFLYGDEKPPTNFYVLQNHTISTCFELNLSRYQGIPRGENFNWKIDRKCDICILKYWWYPKAFRELQIKWNGPVLNLNHSSIFQIKIYRTDMSLLSFALFTSKVYLPPLGAMLSANLRLPTLVSANFLE